MNFDAEEARKHPLIVEFVELVDRVTPDGIPHFEDLKTSPFVKFWKHLIIHRYEDELKDFRTILYGTHICDIYERDCTNLLMAEMGFGAAEEMVRAMNKQVLDSAERIYNTNSLFWREREHKVFHQVKMPLRRGASINEVLVCMTFD